jgi:23S rRNA pseudouridine1911/1915/1917 synthase
MENRRLDLHLVRKGLASSRRHARDLIEAGRVRLNSRVGCKSDLVAAGDRIDVDVEPVAPALVADPAMVLELLYKDASVVVINKPAVMACHPLRPGETGTIMNGIAALFPETAAVGNLPREGGLIHRLDNGTSGALMIARTDESFRRLRAAIRSGAVKRRYRALVSGRMDEAAVVDLPLSHDRRRAHRMIPQSPGRRSGARPSRPASTRIEPLRTYGAFTLLEIYPQSGGRHQIRVHLASIGFPIVGDKLYGGQPAASLLPGRFWLHLAEIEFESDSAGRVAVTAPLPHDLTTLVDG